MIVFLDTNLVICAVENPPLWGPKATGRLTTLRTAGHQFMVSDLTCMECLVGPFQTGNITTENQFRAFFTAAGMQVVAITAAVCERAARIRAQHRFKPMDSLQLAAAVENGVAQFLTNDAQLRSFTGLTVEVLT